MKLISECYCTLGEKCDPCKGTKQVANVCGFLCAHPEAVQDIRRALRVAAAITAEVAGDVKDDDPAEFAQFMADSMSWDALAEMLGGAR